MARLRLIDGVWKLVDDISSPEASGLAGPIEWATEDSSNQGPFILAYSDTIKIVPYLTGSAVAVSGHGILSGSAFFVSHSS